MDIVEQLSCGLDVGTSSVGWGLVDIDERCIPPHIVVHHLWQEGRVRRVEEQRFAAGVVKFDPVEQKQQGKWVSRSGERGNFHRGRKRVQRKQWRLQAIVDLFHASGLVAIDDIQQLCNFKGRKPLDPWHLREEALHRPLTGEELLIALYHIAAHRVFEANSKAGEAAEIAAIGDNIEAKPKAAKKGKLAESFGAGLTSLTQAIEVSGDTVAEYFNTHFQGEDGRKHGLDGCYDRLFKRRLLKDEVKRIFAAQRTLGSAQVTEALQQQYDYLAFYIKEGQDSEKFVGDCAFARDEGGVPLKRAPRFAPSYEQFRFLDKLSSLRLVDGNFPSAEQRQSALKRFGENDVYNWAMLAEAMGVDLATGFKDTPRHPERDFVTARGSCAVGTATLLDALAGLEPTMAVLDLLARKLTHYSDIRSIESALRKSGLPDPIVERTIECARAGLFKFYKGTGHVSIEAARKLSERLLAGDSYKDACLAQGWRHEATENAAFAGLERPASPKQILAILNDTANPPVRSPGARKTVIAAFKQVVAIAGEFGGLPGSVHVELARDIGKSLEERGRADRQRKDNESRNRKQAEQFEEIVGRPPIPGSEDLLRFRLWREQRCECPYVVSRGNGGGYIGPDRFRQDREAGGLTLNIDHILPWSWSHDDSYENLVLCLADENARKRDRTPWEYFGDQLDRWNLFKAWVDDIPKLKTATERKNAKHDDADPGMGGYKRRNLLVDSDEAIAKLKDRLSKRHLNDTRHATRVLAQAIKCLYPVELYSNREGKLVERQRVFARPGQLVGMLRRAWGMNRLKYDENGKRDDERNHAVDAMVGAAITNAGLNWMTREYQRQEGMGGRMGRALSNVPPPWPSFAADVEAARNAAFVVRSERKRARGKLHDAGIFGGGPDQGKEHFHFKLNIQEAFGIKDRKFSAELAREQLAMIKDPQRNKALIASLEAWLGNGGLRDEGERPKDHRGQIIRRITLENRSRKPGIAVHGGDADRQSIIRIDVFSIEGAKRGTRWDFVPVYLYQVLDRNAFPKPPDLEGYSVNGVNVKFAFSLSKGDYVEMIREGGECLEGYYTSFDINTSKLKLSHHSGSSRKIEAAAKTMLTINKYQVDRFGRRSLIREEIRTWHGVACTSPTPPG